MKKYLLVVVSIAFGILAQAQDPVQWTFSAKKIADKTYEVRIKATVQSPWHIYSQNTPDGGPVPTKFNFTKNPLVTIQGETKESGDKKEKFEEVFGIKVKYFKSNAEFVQVVKLKANAKTVISGNVEYMACNDDQCLPPTETKFSIPLN